MEIFTVVATAGQLTRGSKLLNLSKSAVSTALTDLEAYLGVQLIVRDSRNFQLTDLGRDYLNHCQRILDDIHEIEDSTRSTHRELSGPVRITAPVTYGMARISPALTQFLNDNPKIEISLDLTDRLVDLSHENVDVAIRIGELSDSDLIAKPVSCIKMRMVASPSALANGKLSTLDDLKKYNCLRYKRAPNWQLKTENGKLGFSPSGNIESNSGEVLREFAIAGQGIAYLPDFLVDDAIQKEQLVDVFATDVSWNYNVYAVFRQNRHRPLRIRRLIDHLASSLRRDQEVDFN